MIKSKFAKFAALTVGMTFALSVAVSPAGAQTIGDLQAQINALLSQLAALQGGSASTSMTFTQNLTIGSTGSEVVALQQTLVAKGHLVMPAGVAMGYFGPLTQAAVAKWQAANGVSPAAGYWGPISRAKANAMGGVTTPGTQVPGAGISTPGVEGTLTARLASTPTSVNLYEGDTRKAVMGIELEAKTSDIKIERVRLDLGTNTDIYRKIASRLYIMDGSTVLASVDLNSNTVVKDSSNYFITVSGFAYVVPKDSKRVLTVALDAFGSIDSDIISGGQRNITVPTEGVRGVDGAGINQFSPLSGSSFSRSFTPKKEVASEANLKISLNSNSPKTASVVASGGTDKDELDGLELLRFDVRAEKDSVEIIDLNVTINRTGSGTATTTTFYLMDGSNVIDSVNGTTLAASGNSTLSFTDVDYMISKDSTRTLRLVADIRDADSTSVVYRATVSAGSAIVAENSVGDTITDGLKTGSATGDSITVRKSGLEVVLVSKSNLTYTPPQGGVSSATSSANTTFTLRLTASGSDVHVGPQTASSTFTFQTYENGVAETQNVASSTSWSIPSGVSTSGVAAGGFVLTDGQSVDIPVDFFFQGRTVAGALIDAASYAVGLENVKFAISTASGTQIVSNFMAGQTAWRTNSIVMP